MRKSIFRIIAMIILCAAVMCSCASEPEESFSGVFDSASVENNLGGYEFMYRCGEEGTFLGYKEDTFFFDMAKKRVADIESGYNCTFKIIHYVWDDTENMRKAVASGVYYGDAFNMIGDKLEDAAEMGLLVGLSTLSDYFDITDADKWGSRYQLESVSYNDDIYAFVPYYWPEQSFAEMGYYMTINEDTIGRIGATDPREYVENGQWVWAQFRKSIESFSVIEGGETKVYSIPAPEGGFAQMYLFSNGSRLVVADENGNGVFGLNDDRAIVAMQEALDVKNEYDYAFMRNSSVDALENGEIAMIWCDSNTLLKTVSYQVENFGIVKWPTGPAVDPDYSFSVHNNITPTGISILAHDTDPVAFILDKLYEPFEGYETQDAIHAYMMNGVFFDERDCKTFYDMVDNTRFLYFHYGISPATCEFISSSNTVIQSIQEMEHKTQIAFEKNVTPCVRGIIAVYGSYGD